MIGLTGLDLSGYMVKNAVRAIAFYRDLFDIEPFLVYPENRGAEFEMPDGSIFGSWGGGGNAAIPFQPSNGILFAVKDFDAAVAAVKAREIPVIMELDLAHCRMAMLNDTEGNTLTLHQRKSAP